MRSIAGVSALLLLALGTSMLVTRADSPKPPAPSSVPQYDEKGQLKKPTGFETWVFVGTSLGLGYRREIEQGTPRQETKSAEAKSETAKSDTAKSDAGAKDGGEAKAPRPARPAGPPGPGSFHNVYIEPDAYAHFLATGEFRDQTMLAMDVFAGVEKPEQDIVNRGIVSAARRNVEFAVKNKNRPDGSKTDWAYYAFDRDATTAAAFPDRACYDCHLKHADKDNVWTQFYPILRDAKIKP